MPFQYQRDDLRRRITVSLSDPLTEEDARAIVGRQVADDAWRYTVLYETRELTAPPTAAVSRAIIAHVAALAATHGPRGPIAIVATGAPAVAAGSAYAMLSAREGLAVHVFWSRDEAEHWLDARDA